MANHLYPNKVANNISSHMMKAVFTSQANGQSMMTFDVFNNASWTFNYDASVLRQMCDWGVSERTQKIRTSSIQYLMIPRGEQAVVAAPGDNCNMGIDIDTGRHEQPARETSEESANFVNIAPLPSPIDDVIGVIGVVCRNNNTNGNQSTAQSRTNYEKTKSELRKIRNREAAARFYRRKLAAKSRSQT